MATVASAPWVAPLTRVACTWSYSARIASSSAPSGNRQRNASAVIGACGVACDCERPQPSDCARPDMAKGSFALDFVSDVAQPPNANTDAAMQAVNAARD